MVATGKGERLAGKTALVTGAAKGQGAGVARRYAAEGAAVLCVDLLEAEGRALAAEITGAGGRALFCRADVSDEEQARGAVSAAAAEFDGLDILYNNAAVISYGNRVADMPAEEWDRTIAVNLRGPFLMAKHAIPELKRSGGGAIINVSSHGAFQASPVGVSHYAAAKGALLTFTYYLASEYGGEGIRSNCIAPGPVPTDLNSVFLDDPDARAMTETMIPMGRVGEISDIAAAAVFLASDESKWICGAVLRVDGGIVVQ